MPPPGLTSRDGAGSSPVQPSLLRAPRRRRSIVSPGGPVSIRSPSPFLLLVAAFLAWPVPSVLSQETPRFVDVAGHEISERIAQHRHIVAYLDRLHQESPRVQVAHM